MTDGINWTANWYRASLEGYLNLPWKILAYSYFEYAKTLASNRDSIAISIGTMITTRSSSSCAAR